MKVSSIPLELFNICKRTVEQHHSEHGFGKLSSDIETSDNINTIALIPEASAVLKANNRYYQIRKWCFMASIGFVILTVVIPWWSLSILVLIFLADRILAYREKNGWKFLSTVLLSLEFLVNDFSGWGAAYPANARKRRAYWGPIRNRRNRLGWIIICLSAHKWTLRF